MQPFGYLLLETLVSIENDEQRGNGEARRDNEP